MFSSHKPKELCEATDLVLEMNENPLALELFNKTNIERINAGKQQIRVTIWRGLKVISDCSYDSGEIRISNDISKSEQLAGLLFELCNIANCSNHPDPDLTKSPMSREDYIKECEKSEYIAAQKEIKIFRYGVKNNGWDADMLKDEIRFFQQPFNKYYENLKRVHKEHTEKYGTYWDKISKWKEKVEKKRKASI